MNAGTEGDDLKLPLVDVDAIIKSFVEGLANDDKTPEPEPDPAGPFALYVCPRCRRVFAHPANDEPPTRCGVASQVHSTRGVIGTFTTHCDGVPVLYSPAPSAQRAVEKSSTETKP